MSTVLPLAELPALLLLDEVLLDELLLPQAARPTTVVTSRTPPDAFFNTPSSSDDLSGVLTGHT
jgi:hypothetical protein